VKVMESADVSFRLICQHPSDSDVEPEPRCEVLSGTAAPARSGVGGTPVRCELCETGMSGEHNETSGTARAN
jgi:hypothetical protein